MSDSSGGFHRQDLIGRFAQHKVAANLLMLIMLIAGAVGLAKLNTQFLPNFAIDYITVRVIWPGASAEDVASSITEPLEQELRNLDYVKEMRSTSLRGLSSIVLEYEEGTNMGLALDQVKEYVSLVRNLPSDSEEPEITKLTRNEDVADVILTAPGDLDELRPLAYNFETELLNRGIAKVEFVGLPEQEIAIQVPSHELKAMGLSLPQLGQRVISQSQDIPAGTIGQNDVAREVRSLEQKRDVEGFRELTVYSARDGQRIRLGDIAEVEQRAKDSQIEVFYQGQPAVLMKLLRTENSDTLDAARIMHEWLQDTQPTLPAGVELVPFNEAYVLVEERINLLLKNGLGGLVLVVSILFIFLNGRVAFWVTVGIPVSFMGTLAVLYLAGGSINMVSLFALIMALGIIVDDAIVVAEDALTHYTSGENSLQAAEGGARRMLVPVMSSSLTTVSAFIPLMLVGGIIGNILFAIPLVIICVIIASIIECFLILPGHLRHSFAKHHHKPPSRMRRRIDDGFLHFRDHWFRPLITHALDYRSTAVVAAFAAFALALTLLMSGRINFTFFPTPESTVIYASVKFSAGTPPEETQRFARHLEQQLWKTDAALAPEQNLVVTALLRQNTGSFDGGRNFQNGDQYGMVQVELISPDKRDVRNVQFIEHWQNSLRLSSGIEQLSITSPRGGPPGSDIDIFISGPDALTLKQAAEAIAEQLKTYQGVSNIQDDLPYGRQQFVYELTPLGESLGLTVDGVGRQMRAALDGQLLQVFYDKEDEVEVRIMLPDAERYYQRTLESLPIVMPSGDTTPLQNVVNLESRRGVELLRHTDTKLGIHVTAEVDATLTNANVVLQNLQQSFMPELISRYGLNVEYKGKAEEQRETGADMRIGAMVGLTLIYLILAWVFASYVWPLAVMIAIPLGLTGAIFGHWLIGIDLTILSLFGFFGLSGIVINDSIILVTFYKDLRKQGMAVREAIIEATCLRLRAVLLTSLTTIAGLLPLLFETSLQAQFLIPMAVSISFGLAFATVLILIVIPVLLSLIEQFRARIGRPDFVDEDALIDTV